MAEPYPIVDRKTLDRPDRGGPLGLRRRERGKDEIPKVNGQQVRVFSVDGGYLVDHGHRRLDDEKVVRATHVTIVDLTHNRAVQTELTIPSQDAKDFTVRVTFLCTVTDAVTVVRDGQGDAERSLNGYIRSHHRLFQLGLQHKLSEINPVRLNVQTQIEAYVQLKPPRVPGLNMSLASVEVLTPEELAAFQDKVRTEERNFELYRLKAMYDEEADRQRRDWELERKKYELKLSEQRQHYEAMEQLAQQRLQQSHNEFLINEVARKHQAIGDDPVKAAMAAREEKELTATQIADRLQAGKNHAEERADRQQEREFLIEQEERTRRYAMQDALMERERFERDRDYQATLTKLEREYQAEQTALQREYETTQGRELREREDRLQMLRVRLDMLKEIAHHGHLNEVYVDAEQLIKGIAHETGAVTSPLASTATPPELENSLETAGNDPKADAGSGGGTDAHVEVEVARETWREEDY
ncbi:hypothetical protein AB0F17_43790 [Nonomuraea sp. NPDC026600]|uniref:SPFH domain-containing protein n=1 Tax=Nonomuraea sp. NPDC026600 TaxID=3155363 RepID=UPI0033DC3DC1